MIEVILVDENDNPIGTEEKLKAHIDSKLHRAFSIFIFNSKGELMIQKRADNKYHCGGLWTNTCCSHPRVGQALKEDAQERLNEEMGFKCEIHEVFSMPYKAKVPSKKGELTEYEYDHVFIGIFDGSANINPEEAQDWKWINTDELKIDIEKNPDKYTPWIRIILDKLLKAKKEFYEE
jgi:isopentenyl-diphosphate delta-isomerase